MFFRSTPGPGLTSRQFDQESHPVSRSRQVDHLFAGTDLITAELTEAAVTFKLVGQGSPE